MRRRQISKNIVQSTGLCKIATLITVLCCKQDVSTSRPREDLGTQEPHQSWEWIMKAIWKTQTETTTTVTSTPMVSQSGILISSCLLALIAVLFVTVISASPITINKIMTKTKLDALKKKKRCSKTYNSTLLDTKSWLDWSEAESAACFAWLQTVAHVSCKRAETSTQRWGWWKSTGGWWPWLVIIWTSVRMDIWGLETNTTY